MEPLTSELSLFRIFLNIQSIIYELNITKDYIREVNYQRLLYHLSNIILFGVLLFFLSVSLDIQHLPGHVSANTLRDLPLFSMLIMGHQDNYMLNELHMVFLLVWVANFFLVRELFKVNSNRLIGSIVFLVIFPVFASSGKIDGAVFDLLGSSLLLFSMSSATLNQFIRSAIAVLGLIVWCAFGTSYFFMVPMMILWILKGEKTVAKSVVPVIAAVLPILIGLSFSMDIVEFYIPRSFSFMPMLPRILQFDMVSVVSLVLASFWIIYALKLIFRKVDINWGQWLGLIAAFLVFCTSNYHFFAGLSTILFLMNSGVIKAFFSGEKITVGLSYLVLPFMLSGYFDMQERNQWMKLGLKEEFADLAKIAYRIDLPVNVYNNEQGIEELNFFFPEANLFMEKSEPNDSIVDLFEMNSLDIMHWINFRMNNDIKAIYFNFDLERDRHLMFLGSRLSDGEWTLIHDDKDKRALLIRNEDKFSDIINRYAIDPSLGK